ncbi:MAG: hypothetical protein CMN03_03235 [Roseibacillus sp.]|nr:hypothetical protein [Roseibacillus sp.]
MKNNTSRQFPVEGLTALPDDHSNRTQASEQFAYLSLLSAVLDKPVGEVAARASAKSPTARQDIVLPA